MNKMNGKNRNKPCYCGSGLKTKKCWKNHYSLPIPNGIELPTDYKKPSGWSHDLGLTLYKEGIKNHKLCFSGIDSECGISTTWSFPEMDSDLEKTTTHISKSSNLKIVSGVPVVTNTVYPWVLPWLSEEKNEEYLDEEFMWTILFKKNSDKQKFIELHDSEKVFIVNVEVGGLRINNTYGKTECYCELEFKSFEILETHFMNRDFKKEPISLKEVV